MLKNCKNIYKKIIKSNNGLAALLVVLIIGASSLLMARGSMFLSIGEADMGETVSKSGGAYYSAESCLEEALLRIKRDNNFSVDNLELTVNGNLCVIDVSGTDTDKDILIYGTSGVYQKRLRASLSINAGEITIKTFESF